MLSAVALANMDRFVFTCWPTVDKRRTFGLVGDALQERFRDGAGHRWEVSNNTFALDYGISTRRACDVLANW